MEDFLSADVLCSLTIFSTHGLSYNPKATSKMVHTGVGYLYAPVS